MRYPQIRFALHVCSGKGCGLYGVQVQCTVLMQQLPRVPPVLPHVSAVESDHAAVVRMCRTCACDAAPQSISRGRRTASVCVAHAPMHPRSSAVLPAATADPHAPRKLIRSRSAHVRGLCLRHDDCELAAGVAGAGTGFHLLLERVARSVADLDGHTAARVESVPGKEPGRRAAARPREAYPGPPSPCKTSAPRSTRTVRLRP